MSGNNTDITYSNTVFVSSSSGGEVIVQENEVPSK